MKSSYKAVLASKIKESFFSVLPVTVLVLILSLTFVPLPNNIFISFLFGAFLMVVGIGFFSIGADKSMTPIGEYVGTEMTRSRKIWLICLLSFLVGVLITVSEPDLQVLAAYVPAIDTTVFILSVAVGVGVFLVLAFVRIVFNIKVRYILLASYAFVFILAAFVSPDFWSVAFDAGGVTTGPISVPFIIALGVGVSAVSSDKEDGDNGFGLAALCSVGPVVAILVLGCVYEVDGVSEMSKPNLDFVDSVGFGGSLFDAFAVRFVEVAEGLLPVVIFFFVYQLLVNRLSGENLLKITVGVVFTYIGIALFLTGVNIGYLPVGSFFGATLGSSDRAWLLVPLGCLLGYFIVAAEPAVQILQKQVEEVTDGAIPKKMLSTALSVGVSLAVGLAMLRVITGISIFWFVGIGYGLCLTLSFIVPEIFTSIAFDSGGVASGSMASAFLMPLAVGATTALGGSMMTDAFGVIALVALLPTLTMQLLGLVYTVKSKAKMVNVAEEETDSTVIEFASPVEMVVQPAKAAENESVDANITVDNKYPDIIEFDLQGRW